MSSLVREIPKAQITLAGASTTCVLDNGAETSSISTSFYTDRLAGKLSKVQHPRTYLSVYGTGNNKVPIEGYIRAPLVVHNQTIDAHFLVVGEFRKGEARNHKSVPVVLGCNILHKLKDIILEPKQADIDAWTTAINWYQLPKQPVAKGRRRQKQFKMAELKSGQDWR